jgi:hypothetical protein
LWKIGRFYELIQLLCGDGNPKERKERAWMWATSSGSMMLWARSRTSNLVFGRKLNADGEDDVSERV